MSMETSIARSETGNGDERDEETGRRHGLCKAMEVNILHSCRVSLGFYHTYGQMMHFSF